MALSGLFLGEKAESASVSPGVNQESGKVYLCNMYVLCYV